MRSLLKMADDLYKLRAKYRAQARQKEAEYSRQATRAMTSGGLLTGNITRDREEQ